MKCRKKKKIENKNENEKIKTKINPFLTFKNFFLGKSNEFAIAASKQVINNPGKIYNPLFIYAKTGLGKTHLINAIGNSMLKKNPNIKIRLSTSEELVNKVVKANFNKNFNNFKYFYNSLKFLLIDDFEFLIGKNKTQEEFFYIFEGFKKTNRQIIITSNLIPKQMLGINEKIISRIEEGLIIFINPPELKMRINLLLKKAYLMKINLSYEIAFFIAQNFTSNINELLGILKSIKIFLKIYKTNLTINIIKKLLINKIKKKKKQILIKNIQKIITKFYNFKKIDLNSKKRYINIIKYKQIAIYFSKKFTNKSLKEISLEFKYKNHTSVLYAIKKIKFLKKNDKNFKKELYNLKKIIKK
ncbi:chromosomal replication initiator protein DnaA [Candidatus Zinderia endosymbiont of Aphrophora alni]|uniref:chromosomal replication initiator protein DnaA n=1 Tax=Candidatus Zinderia endosymbiont of Aphrophora alni TaxID=3077951 RepID=UPI0030D09150